MSELECTLSTKRNRIHELEEQVQRANVSSLHANEISEQLRRQILELKQANDAILKEREERRFFTLSDLTLSGLLLSLHLHLLYFCKPLQ